MKKIPSSTAAKGASGQVPLYPRGGLNLPRGYGAPLWLFGLSLLAIAAAFFAMNHIHGRVSQLQSQLVRFDQKPLALTAATQLETALGYEGFLGTLGQFAVQPSIQQLSTLKNQLEQAEQALLTIAASAPLKADVRMGALQAAVQMYRQEFGRAEQMLTSGQPILPGTFRSLDDVYNNIVAASARLERQMQAQNQVLLQDEYDALQSLVALLIFVTFMLVLGAWLVGRIAYADPLAKLLSELDSASVMNPAVKLWGVDRADAIGQLARALETLRQKLLNAPDVLVSVGGDTQPLRFGGSSGAVFQALVGELAGAVRQLRAADMPTTLTAIESLSKALASTAAISYEDLRDSTNAIRNVAHSLAEREAQISGAAALLENSTISVTEISRLTGVQVQASLRDLVGAQNQMRNTAAAGDAVVKGFATKADDLAEKLVAATNLMRAGGKVLQETVEGLRGRVLDATAALTQSDAKISQWLTQSDERLGALATRAEQVFEHNRAGSEALAEMVAAGERISATAGKLELSQTDLTRAVTAMLSQSDMFAPLTMQLKDLHDQLTTHMTKQVAVGEDAMTRLTQQTDRLAQLNDELENGPLASATQRLGKISELTDSLAGIIQHMQNLPQNLSESLAPLQQLNDGAVTTLTEALNSNTASTEMNALRLDANLNLVQNQLTDLLTKLTADQTALFEQVNALRGVLTGVPLSSITPQHIAEVETALSARIEQQYQTFTADLTSMLKRFEENVAGHVTERTASAEADNIQLSPVARAVLTKLRSEQPDNDALLDPAADLDMVTAITRISQIKKLTGALTRQTRVLAGVQYEMAETPNAAQPNDGLAERAKEIIGDVMEAISELTQLASAISDISQQKQNS